MTLRQKTGKSGLKMAEKHTKLHETTSCTTTESPQAGLIAIKCADTKQHFLTDLQIVKESTHTLDLLIRVE
ncbi:hypothetical protein BM477_00415 [Boudabousia marimammalium]|uniref:Uncharacterized protein n=1 Tax=Boudabousia marimammalium TaxID=156892 RepID=A0A1Q5PSG2_9ACTO|nr:hypothetical protein BM477_00415 [Boudabousia marimammalium]